MSWVLIGALVVSLAFSLLAYIGAALYDPASGKKRPEEGKLATDPASDAIASTPSRVRYRETVINTAPMASRQVN